MNIEGPVIVLLSTSVQFVRHCKSVSSMCQGCVPTLVDLTLDGEVGGVTRLASLQALTNLSASGDNLTPYTRLVQQLYFLLTAAPGSPAHPGPTGDAAAAARSHGAVRLQALKILVNLSCNADMVPHLLAAKVSIPIICM